MSRPTVQSLRSTTVRFASLLGALTVILQAPAAPALAKRLVMQTPTYGTLTEGAGPETNDVRETHRAGKGRLSPLSLDDKGGSGDLGPAVDAGGKLSATVSATNFAPKGPIDPTSKSLFIQNQSIKGGTDSIYQAAKGVNAMPLQLMESADEAQKKLDTVMDAEKLQLADLWESTLSKSPDIQFVVQKLMPTSNPGRASTVMMRMLSTAMFGAMSAANYVMPSTGTYMGTNVGSQLIANVLQLQESKQAQKARISQTEAIMLYNMVRNTADKLVEAFRGYKKSNVTLAKALTDLSDLQDLVRDASAGQDSAKQVEMNYTIRKAQRDVDAVSEDVKKERQKLIDLAGSEAVAKLDRQLEEEMAKLDQVQPQAPADNQQTAQAPGTQS